MPLYEYECKCGFKCEKIATVKTVAIPCPDCEKEAKRIMSASNFAINGYSEKNGYSKR